MKKFTLYKTACVAMSLLCTYLFILLFFSSEQFILDMGLEPNLATEVLGKRVAVIMLGVVIISLGARKLPVSQFRQWLCVGFAVILLGLSATGWHEFFRETVNNSIFTAIIIETTLGIMFLLAFLKGRKRITT